MSVLSIKIAFLPWGDPHYWELVEYCLEDTNGINECIEGYTTLSIIVDKLRYNNIFILVPWTVIRSEKVSEIMDSREGPIYDKLVCVVREYIWNYAFEQIKKWYRSHNIKMKILVLPGVIRYFTDNSIIVFKTNIDNLLNYALYALYSTINDVLEERGVKQVSGDKTICLEALLDTTHGINYFTFTIGQVLDQVLAMISVSKRCRVLLSIYNADPFRIPKRARSDVPVKHEVSRPRLYYHKISEKVYSPWHISTHIKFRENEHNNVFKNRRGTHASHSKETGAKEDLTNVLNNAKQIITAYRLGLVPILVHLVGKGIRIDLGNKMINIIESTLKQWREEIVLSKRSDKEIVIETKQDLADGFRLLLYAHAIFSSVSEFLKERGYDLEIVESGVKLNDLSDLVRILYEDMEIVKRIFEHECNLLEEYKESIMSDWKLFSKLKKERRKNEKQQGREREKECYLQRFWKKRSR